MRSYRQFHPDRLGSVRYISDANGVIGQSTDRDAYGNVIGSDNLSTGYGFAGTLGYEEGYRSQTDPSAGLGLLYLEQRYYDPETGGFLSPDPIGLAGGINLYAYVGNDPVNGVDPDGLAVIEVHWRPITVDISIGIKGNVPLPANHAYITIEDETTGKYYFFSGGPPDPELHENRYQKYLLTVRFGEWGKDAYDYKNNPYHVEYKSGGGFRDIDPNTFLRFDDCKWTVVDDEKSAKYWIDKITKTKNKINDMNIPYQWYGRNSNMVARVFLEEARSLISVTA